ncbi:MFS transporter [Propionivibrio sp.]|uniref:MFS transporter n=1 Tax=Propionivibrio sp. TaxID=2212460 RepID=UPI003BF54413
MALAGFTCFFLLYGTQPILPQLTHEFGISPAMASLSVSAGTAAMAFLLIPLSLVSDRYGRASLMRWCLFGAAVFAFGSSFAPDYFVLLLSRICLGACIAGVPAAAMAYLGEELAPELRSRAMGLYIAANALGGMSGRLIAALVTEYLSWRHGLATLGIVGLLAAIGFLRLIPAGLHFFPQPMQLRPLYSDLRTIYADPGLPWLFWTAFLIMGAFVGLYNFLGFRLSLEPYALGPAAIGAIFLLYALGSVSSVLAGRATTRHPRHKIMLLMSCCMAAGISMTWASSLPIIIAGLAILTFGFFAVHAVASGWVGHRAGQRRGLVSALYLSSYYLGGSVIGSAAGWPWEQFHWAGVVVALLLPVLLVIAMTTLRLRRLSDS